MEHSAALSQRQDQHKAVKERFTDSLSQPSPPPPPSTGLLSLPPELLLQISSFLPSSSIALLALTSKQLLSLLSKQSFTSLLTQRQQQKQEHQQQNHNQTQISQHLAFLILLSHDLTAYFACHNCYHLHLTSCIVHPSEIIPVFTYDSSHSCREPPQSQCPHSHKPKRKPKSRSAFSSKSNTVSPPDHTSSTVKYPNTYTGTINGSSLLLSNYLAPYTIQFAHVQLALKRHLHGSEHGIDVRDLAYREVRVSGSRMFMFDLEGMIDPVLGRKSASDSEPASGHGGGFDFRNGSGSREPELLLLRVQEWVIPRTEEFGPKDDFEKKRMTFGVCAHLMTYNAEWGLDDSLTGVLRCRFSHEVVSGSESMSDLSVNSDEYCTCKTLHNCAVCPTEYKVDIVDLKDLGSALCITRWMALGSGSSLRDPLWRSHDRLLDDDDIREHGLELGSIRSRFEGLKGVGGSVENLTKKNREDLMMCLIRKGGVVEMKDGSFGWREVGGGKRSELKVLRQNEGAESWWDLRKYAPVKLRDCIFLAICISLAVELMVWGLYHVLAGYGW